MTTPNEQYPDTRTHLAVLEVRMYHMDKKLSQQDDVLERLDAKVDRLLEDNRRRPSERPAKDSFVINRSTILAGAFFVASVLQQLASAYLVPSTPPQAPKQASQAHDGP